MTRVVIIEDHTLVRQSLVKTLEAEPGFEVVGEAGRGDEGLGLIKQHSPDLAILRIARVTYIPTSVLLLRSAERRWWP